jgi:hypothetical protein
MSSRFGAQLTPVPRLDTVSRAKQHRKVKAVADLESPARRADEGLAMGTYDWMELQTLTNEIAAARSRLAAARATRDMGKARGLEEEIARAEARRERLLAHITTNLVGGPESPPGKGGKNASVEESAAGGEVAEEAAASDAEPAPEAVAQDPKAAEVAIQDAEEPEEKEETASEPEPALDAAPAEAAAAAPADDVLAAADTTDSPADTTAHDLPQSEDQAVATGAAPPAPAPQAASAQGGINVWDQLKPSDIERAREDLVTRRAETLARHAEELRALDTDQSQLDVLEQAIASFLQKFTGAPAGAGVVKLEEERELRQQGG